MEVKNLPPAKREADLRTFFENIVRILRQPEEQGEDSSNPQVEILIKGKLRKRILSEILKWELANPNRTIQKLRKKSEEIILLEEQVTRINPETANQRPEELHRMHLSRNSSDSNTQLTMVRTATHPPSRHAIHPSHISRQQCVSCGDHHCSDNCT